MFLRNLAEIIVPVAGIYLLTMNDCSYTILSRYPYPWHKIRGFRNFILHEYHAIEYRIVWDAAKNDLTVLKKVLNEILENEF